ncbi:tRNA pseudouridine(13) synthase TruD [Idiomarina xiamenensis]|uniref:tRNA pseudouridine synthase D n=1 Tax=Idiomarina xiamenensis 10-D-4 TaxID=740709 RepID=K2JMN9_9GAMM|nr:tRNA pseudouridine(13) synthase TruD [Idiomarina xiamenensis]EKE84791.1 hypothetical protein A10D4_04235 [Idiomarina xiamenensis 10-D-4]
MSESVTISTEQLLSAQQQIPRWQDMQTELAEPPSAGFKCQAEDFQVTELLDVDDDGEGEHQWLWVKKRGANTRFVAEQLAKFAGVSAREVSHSGMKDRQAVTWQWFSIQLPGQPLLDWQALEHPEFVVEKALLRQRKLRIGTHKANRFQIRLRDVSDRAALQQRWQFAVAHGVPNYFGEQRFGRQGSNLTAMHQWLLAGGKSKRLKKSQKSLLLSSARSFLFNQVLAYRLQQQQLQTLFDGDVVNLAGSRSWFVVEQVDDSLRERLQQQDILLTGPLSGRVAGRDAEQPRSGAGYELEQAALADWQPLVQALIDKGVQSDRRPLLLYLQQPQLSWQDNDCLLSFDLSAGSFASSVIRELIVTEHVGIHEDITE